jgi:hypothetical protein
MILISMEATFSFDSVSTAASIRAMQDRLVAVARSRRRWVAATYGLHDEVEWCVSTGGQGMEP